MARARVAKLAWNRGLVSRLGLARSDIKRLELAAEVQTNWIPRVLGSMMLRPGLGHLGSTQDDAFAYHLDFVFSLTDKAAIELTSERLRVKVDDVAVTRGAVSTTISNGSFDMDLAGWTDADEAAASSDWAAGGYMGLTGTGTSFAIRRQQLTIAGADQGQEHAVHLVVERGPVILRIGSSAGDDDYLTETSLGTGVHSLAFTPTGASAWIDLKSRLERQILVDSCTIESAGSMIVETPWLEADLRKIRHGQSADVIFVACDGYQQYRIERRATRSWSVVLYEPEDGPFRTPNVTTTTLTASGLTGNITLTASKPIFRPGHVGALFQHVSVGQRVEATITAQNSFTEPIRITGVTSTRIFTIVITGLTATGSTVTLQRSLDEPGNWEDVAGESYTVDTTKTFDDGLDNQVVHYRVGVKTGDYVAGTIEASLAIGIGSITGVARITAFSSDTVVSAEVLSAIGSLEATEDWSEGRWSDYRGYPSAVSFHEGRLAWGGRDRIDLSISDAFDGFDPEFEGDAAPISRSIGTGPVDVISWMISLQRLILGGQGAEFSVRSSSLDEPLTPTNFNMKRASTQGSADVPAVVIDHNGAYVQRGGVRIYELAWGETGIDYQSSHLSALVPEIGLPGIVKLLVQRQPDTRLHAIRSDGTVAMMISDRVEQVICWIEVETDGAIEDGLVLPGAPGEEEDAVYYVVRRTIDGATKRYWEKWAFEAQCRGGTLNRQADSFVTYSQAPSATISGLSHLEGKPVVVWDNGKCLSDAAGDIATFTVSGGAITVTNAGAAYLATQGVVGLPYSASYQSAKPVELMESQTGTLTDTQIIKGLSLILADVHAKGLKFGQSLVESEMDALPEIEDGAPVDPDTIHTDYATEKITFPGTWSSDARLCLLAQAPRPCTVLAAIAEIEHHG